MPDAYLHQLHTGDLAPLPAVEALVHAATQERVAAIEKLIRGYTNQVYRATMDGGRQVIVRIPFADHSFDAEATAMRQARAAGAPVPEILLLAPIATARGPRQAMVLAAASGQPLVELEPSLTADQRAVVYTHVGTALRTIHSITRTQFGTADEAYATWQALLDARLAACQRAAAALRSAGLRDTEIAALLRQVASLGDPAPRAAVLCHGDLWTEHIFVDAALHVSAIIDWGEAVGAEPALDLAMLRMLQPDVDLGWVQRGYGADVAFDGAFQQRMTAHTTVVAMQQLDFARGQGDAESVAAARARLRQNLARGSDTDA